MSPTCATCGRGVRVAGQEVALPGGDLRVWCKTCAGHWSALTHAENALIDSRAYFERTHAESAQLRAGRVASRDGAPYFTPTLAEIDAAALHAVRVEMDRRAGATHRLAESEKHLAAVRARILRDGGPDAFRTPRAPCTCHSCERAAQRAAAAAQAVRP